MRKGKDCQLGRNWECSEAAWLHGFSSLRVVPPIDRPHPWYDERVVLPSMAGKNSKRGTWGKLPHTIVRGKERLTFVASTTSPK